MDNELISKKEILDVTGISYGQLYRWKRKNLIPEDWFIKKSTYTGQETFFPRTKILERIDKILGMKENLSLDDMADLFSPMLKDVLMKKQELVENGIVTESTCQIYETIFGETVVFPFDKILYISVLDHFLASGAVSLDEGRLILRNLEKNYLNFKEKGCQIVFLRKLGVSASFLTATPNELYFDESVKLVEIINIPDLIEELKIKIFK